MNKYQRKLDNILYKEIKVEDKPRKHPNERTFTDEAFRRHDR
jgi:hypothetical protein